MSRLDELGAYLGGELDAGAEAALEDALFDAPDDPDLAFLDRLVRHGAHLLGRGTFHSGLTHAEVQALLASGRRVQLLDFGRPGRGVARVEPDAEQVVTRMELGPSSFTGDRIDVEMELPDHGITKRVRDVVFDPATGVLYGVCERPLFDTVYTVGHLVIRAIAKRDGKDELLGEYDLYSAEHAP